MNRSLLILTLVVAATLVGCGGAPKHTVQLVNKTARPIEQIFIFTPGQDKGPSRASLAPNASTTMQLPAGNHEIYAVSQKIIHDDKTRETPEASQTIELRQPLELVFYDSNNEPPGIQAYNVRGIMFRITAKKKPDDGGEVIEADGPSVDAPPPE